MRRSILASMIVFGMVILPALSAGAQVLGACGKPSENTPASEETIKEHFQSGFPMPGENAINFELPAVVGDEIKMVKLSDYTNKWRVVCFYPADFTFV